MIEFETGIGICEKVPTKGTGKKNLTNLRGR
jgi:hypothetical protein